MVEDKAVTKAKEWRDLLRKQAAASHSFELGSSSVTDLANALDELLKVHEALDEECNGYKDRLAKLEQNKAKRPQIVKESGDAVA